MLCYKCVQYECVRMDVHTRATRLAMHALTQQLTLTCVLQPKFAQREPLPSGLQQLVSLCRAACSSPHLVAFHPSLDHVILPSSLQRS